MTNTKKNARASGLPVPTRVTDDGVRVIDINVYAPYFLASINSSLSRGASALYQSEFGVGVTEWRVLSWIATEPGCGAARICDGIAIDKGAVSRAITRLETMGLLSATPAANDPRRKYLTLTEAGFDLHARMMEVSLEREIELLDGVDPKDYEAFLRVMRKLRANVKHL